MPCHAPAGARAMRNRTTSHARFGRGTSQQPPGPRRNSLATCPASHPTSGVGSPSNCAVSVMPSNPTDAPSSTRPISPTCPINPRPINRPRNLPPRRPAANLRPIGPTSTRPLRPTTLIGFAKPCGTRPEPSSAPPIPLPLRPIAHPPVIKQRRHPSPPGKHSRNPPTRGDPPIRSSPIAPTSPAIGPATGRSRVNPPPGLARNLHPPARPNRNTRRRDSPGPDSRNRLRGVSPSRDPISRHPPNRLLDPIPRGSNPAPGLSPFHNRAPRPINPRAPSPATDRRINPVPTGRARPTTRGSTHHALTPRPARACPNPVKVLPMGRRPTCSTRRPLNDSPSNSVGSSRWTNPRGVGSPRAVRCASRPSGCCGRCRPATASASRNWPGVGVAIHPHPGPTVPTSLPSPSGPGPPRSSMPVPAPNPPGASVKSSFPNGLPRRFAIPTPSFSVRSPPSASVRRHVAPSVPSSSRPCPSSTATWSAASSTATPSVPPPSPNHADRARA